MSEGIPAYASLAHRSRALWEHKATRSSHDALRSQQISKLLVYAIHEEAFLGLSNPWVRILRKPRNPRRHGLLKIGSLHEQGTRFLIVMSYLLSQRELA